MKKSELRQLIREEIKKIQESKLVLEKQMKGLDGIDSNTPLTKISYQQKLKIIQGAGNNIPFIVPSWSDRNFWQVFSKGKIKKRKDVSGEVVYYLPGRFKDSPHFKSEKELVAVSYTHLRAHET